MSQGRVNPILDQGLLRPPTKIRTDNDFVIQHDEVIIADEETVETGSFNYTQPAESRNNENALVITHSPQLAKTYLTHWQNRWNRGRD
ncbi:phospholipase D-like domain-containing protein [Entomobacter blattae]